MVSAYGALTSVLLVREGGRNEPDEVAWKPGLAGRSFGAINADLLMKRLWIGDSDAAAVDHLTKVAAACRDLPAGLLDGLHGRRAAAARHLSSRSGSSARSVLLTPQWRVVVGHGEDTVHETSLTMSPTYGFPIFPGSALKGVAASQARAVHGDVLPDAVARLFGTPRPRVDVDAGIELDADALIDGGAGAAQGAVVVLDALPVSPPEVVVDVLTPHVKPYYDKDPDGAPKEPPAEYHNPVPVRFLAVEQTSFQAWLIGLPDDVKQLGELLCDGVDDLGLGGKTSAGYGYCKAVLQP
jgi:CRISPR type III-B/RAMP module RAMP protein Cmr6